MPWPVATSRSCLQTSATASTSTSTSTSMSSVLSVVPLPDTVMAAAEGRNYSYMFNFEQVSPSHSHKRGSALSFLLVVDCGCCVQEFEPAEHRLWMEEHWVAVCLWASSLYLLLIFGGQHLMANRQHLGTHAL